MRTVAFPVIDGVPDDLLIFINNFELQEAFFLKLLHQIQCLCFGVNTKHSGQRTQFTDPLAGCLHVSHPIDGSLIRSEVRITEKCHQAKKMNVPFIMELFMIIEMSEPLLQYTYFGESNQLSLLFAAHLILLPSRN